MSRWFAEHRTTALDRLAAVGTFVGDTLFALVLSRYAGAWLAVMTRAVRPPAYERWRGQVLGADPQ